MGPIYFCEPLGECSPWQFFTGILERPLLGDVLSTSAMCYIIVLCSLGQDRSVSC